MWVTGGTAIRSRRFFPRAPIEVPLNCSTSALLMARSFGSRAMAVPGSMTIKVSGVPRGLVKEVATALQSDEVFLQEASSALEGTGCGDRSSFRAPYVFVSKSSAPAPRFQRDDATVLSDDHVLLPLRVTVFGPVDCQRRDFVTASNAGRSLLSLLRGELAPGQRFRWWSVSRSSRPVDFMAMWPTGSPTGRQHWWADTIQRHVLEACPNLLPGPSRASVLPSGGESFFFLLTWSNSFRKEAISAIDAMLRDLRLPASRTSIPITFR